jgi:HlyD family secretion protein
VQGKRRWPLFVAGAAIAALLALVFWWQSTSTLPLPKALAALFSQDELPAGIVSSNGRIEATEVDVASKLAGRLTEVVPREGQAIAAGDVVARLDTESLEAERRQARAEQRRARQEREHAQALVEQRAHELAFAQRELARLQRLSAQNQFVSEEGLDRARTAVRTSEAGLRAARIQVVASEAAIEAAEAAIERIAVAIEDSVLRAPRSARVLYRLAEPGEVIGVGGKVLTLLDTGDVYMVVFLPETVVGRVALNAEARIVFDAASDYVIPATVSFVAPRAQFTPKQVETRSAREKLSFRVKLQIDPELLARYEPLVKTGVPGVGYVRIDPEAAWPQRLQPRLPPWQENAPTTSSN